MVKYIYLDDEGNVGVGLMAPTATDLQLVRLGSLRVLKIEDIRYAPDEHHFCRKDIVVLDTEPDGSTETVGSAVLADGPGAFHVIR
jgi:hypothetical protein